MNQNLERLFPRLQEVGYEVTSPADPDYNCIAWAAGDESRWWWPDEFHQYYWPNGIARRATLEAFVQAFEKLGFEICENSALETGWEKAAIFLDDDGIPTHAARQLLDGTWTSKLGKLEDIGHPNLDDLSGEVYGKPVIILRRRRLGA